MTGQVRQFRRWIAAAAALLAAPLSTVAHAQESPVTITGRVTGEGGLPLRSANVSIAELNLTVLVGPEGNYRLVVPGARAQGQEVALRARMLGYQARSFAVRLTPGASIQQDFQLTSDPLRLEEVVVTGAGTETLAERLGTARASVDATEIQRANEPANVIQALAGKVPNVITNQSSGDAGASTSIQIRGAKTFGTSQPLIIVDGVPISNNTRGQGQAGALGTASLSGAPSPNRAADVNPDDIESIEILKGAAATSIYGAAAGSAGAILITTKRGRPGRTQYSLRSTYQADEPIKTVPFQRSYGVGTQGVSGACTAVDCALAAGRFFSWGPALPAGTPTYDHAAEIYETGSMFDNTLSVSGGGERTTFYLSAGLLDHDGFVVQDKDFLKRYTFRVNGSHAVTDDLTVGASASYVQTRSSGVDRGNAINGLTLNAQRQPPEFNAKEFLSCTGTGCPTEGGFHRSWRFPNPGATCAVGVGRCSRGFDNPFYAINEHELLGETGRYFGNITASYRPFTWLSANWTLGGDYNSDDRTYAYGVAASGLAGGQLERWQFYDRIIDHNLTATGTHQFNPNISTSLTLGQNLNETYFRQVDVVAATFIAPKPYKLENTVTRQPPTDDELRRRVDGYFGQLNADFYDQLFVQARLRSDGNSAFGEGNQRALYPGGSIAWSFTKAVDVPANVLSFGKIRVAYGESGQQPPLYSTQDNFTAAAFSDFNPGSLQSPNLNGLGGLYEAGARGNPDIKPERVRELEAGIDLSFFNGRADLSVTRYDSKSSDVIFNVPTPPSTGYNSIALNAGEITNKGWEVTSRFRAYQNRDLSIDFEGNWARNRNMVTSLGRIDSQTCAALTQAECAPGTIPIATPESCGPTANLPRCVTGLGSSFSGQTTHAQVGYPLGVWRSTDFARCGRGLTTIGTNDIAAACQGAPDGALYIGPNGFPIGDGNQRAIGNPWPDWTAGISGYVQYKGVQLSAFLDHRQGGNVLNMTRASMYQYGTHKDTEIRGQTRTFGQDMLCHNITCDVLNGPVVGPGVGTPVVIGEGWFSDGTKGPGGALGAVGGAAVSSRIEDATHTRLREVSIAYTFKAPWVQRVAGMQSVDVKLSGRNLKLWSDYSGLDPETNLGGAQNANRGIDWFTTPLTRAWVVSVALHH
jgi:TonB-linked SusC/RagA family outer membrane protein